MCYLQMPVDISIQEQQGAPSPDSLLTSGAAPSVAGSPQPLPRARGEGLRGGS